MVKDIQQATSVHNSIYSSSTSLWYFCTMFILNSNKCVPPVFYRSDEILYVHVDNIGEWISSWSREVSLPFMLSLSLSPPHDWAVLYCRLCSNSRTWRTFTQTLWNWRYMPIAQINWWTEAIFNPNNRVLYCAYLQFWWISNCSISTSYANRYNSYTDRNIKHNAHLIAIGICWCYLSYAIWLAWKCAWANAKMHH